MDIGSKSGFPSGNLSNFQPHVFNVFIDELPTEIIEEIDDSTLALLEEINGRRVIPCNSMEGFLQGLKFDKSHIQIEVCKLVGFAAKRKGSNRNRRWKPLQTLWILGVPMKRKGDLYQQVLDVGFSSLNRNKKFRNALEATHKAVLKHSMGKTKEQDTVLTIREFCRRLTKLRDNNKL